MTGGNGIREVAAMREFLNRAIRKVARECSRVSIIAGMLIHSGNLPEFSEALASLQKLSPDEGGSCWTDDGYEHEDRSLVLSVIIPVYNAQKYIVDCLESVLQQQVSFDYEVILVNDGSTDSTASVLEKYENHERVRILHQENRGASAARNKGIACSKGEYLCFVDSDDELPQGALAAFVNMACAEQAKLVFGSYEKCLRNGTVQYTDRLKDGRAEIRSLPGFAAGRIVHYSVFQNLRFPEGYWYEDSIMAQIVHPLCRDAACTLSQICYKYYSNEAGSTARSKGNRKSLDSLWITMRLLNERKLFGLDYTQDSYEYFLSMVNLTYHRTKDLGAVVARSIFTVQRMLLDLHYENYEVLSNPKKRRIQKALRANDFRKYILACESKR